MTSEQNTFMFLKAGPYNGISDELYSEIVRYFQMIDKHSLRERNRSEEHTSELQSRQSISYAVFCL